MKDIRWGLKWLRKHIGKFNVEKALRWYYRKGIRRGLEKGRLEGQAIARANNTNTCPMHHVPIYLNWIDLVDGSRLQVWTCPYWQEHTTIPVHQQTGKMLAAYILAKHEGAGPHTAIMAAVPKKPSQPLTRKLIPLSEKEEQ